MPKAPPINYQKLPDLIENAFRYAQKGDKRGIDRLHYYLQTSEYLPSETRYIVADKLYQLNDTAGIQFLEEMLIHPDYENRYEAAYWLAQHDRPDAITVLVKGLDSDYFQHYAAACKLAALGDKRALKPLLELYENSIDGTIRDDIAQLLIMYFADEIEAIEALAEQLEHTRLDYEMAEILSVLTALDTQGERLHTVLFPFLSHENILLRKKVAEAIIDAYLGCMDLDLIAFLEKKYESEQAKQIVHAWLNKHT